MRALNFALLLLLWPAPGLALTAPSGWRFPGAQDRSAEGTGSDATFHIAADFNGDGLPDEAWILFRRGGKSWAVFVFLQLPDGRARTIKLLPERHVPAQRYVLETIRPSALSFRTACGKGFGACAKGEPLTIQFRLPSISVCLPESSCSVYVWQPQPRRFQQIRMRD